MSLISHFPFPDTSFSRSGKRCNAGLFIFVDKITDMNCEFESLYFSDNGYVVRCKDCNHFQLGCFSLMLTLDETDFKILCNVVYERCCSDDSFFADNARSFIVPTPYRGIQFALTRRELLELNYMLEKAEDEIKALAMISLFNPE